MEFDELGSGKEIIDSLARAFLAIVSQSLVIIRFAAIHCDVYVVTNVEVISWRKFAFIW